jgi:peptidoglycan/xylan/chitin deacetylase (PgdA/CDA1 family)
MEAPSPSAIVASTLAAGALSAAAILAHAMFSPRSPLLTPVTWHGPRSGNHVALTFDDGPWPGSTEPILDLLAAARARATFFVIGRYAADHPALIRSIAQQGHALANHTFDHHRNGLFRGQGYWREQIHRCDDAIAQITGNPPTLFRPPMGLRCPPMARVLRSLPHRVVTWSIRTRDGTSTDPAAIAARASRAAPGDIILLHDGRDPASRRDVGITLAALPRVLESLHDRDLRSVTVDELLTPSAPHSRPPALESPST